MPEEAAQAFLSYAHADDEYLEGGIIWLREELQRAMRVCTGKPFQIFMDKDGIKWGQHFPSRLDEALEGARFLIPIMSQCYFTSDYCRKEAEFFLDLESKAGRHDLILPIYLIDADVLEDLTLRKTDKLAEELAQRQYADWRDHALKLRKSPVTKRSVLDLAKQMKLASKRVAKDAAPIIPEQMIGIHFLTNRDGLIDHAKDSPSLPEADHNRLQSLRVSVLEACERAIESFSETARRNMLSALFNDLERYRALIDAPVFDIDLSEVWCRGVAVAHLVASAGKDLERLEPQASDHERQALLNTFIRQHMAFVLATPEGKALHEKADRYPTSRDQRAKIFELMERLGDAVQENGDLVTDHVKSLLDTFCRRLDHEALPEQHLLAVLSTCRNLLLAIAEAATGKDVHDIGDEAMEKARVAATRFLLGNEGLARQLASSGYDGLAWLDHVVVWLRSSSTPTIITNDFWTPGRVFRDIDELWCPEMVVIPAGEFMMGSPEDEEGRRDNEGPQHLVTIRKPFALGRYPVTFEEFDHYCEETARDKPGDEGLGRGRRPVINVSWTDAGRYCDWLTRKTGFTYVLPSESWWEYACRAGSTMAYAFGETIDEKQANFSANVGKTTEVGAYPENAFKLFDMHGNVWEWCDDHYHSSYEGAPSNGSAWLDSQAEGVRVLRGGSWAEDARLLRSACRFDFAPDLRIFSIGFRCARVQD